MIDDMLASAKAIDNRTKVRADSRTNALIVEAIPSELSKIKALVERVDLKTPQVKIRTRIIEVLKQVNRF